MTRVGYGYYVWRRLVRAGHTELAASASDANGNLLAAGRKVEDLELPAMGAVADRDADDDDLDDTTQEMRLKMASDHVGANLEQPYTDVFHHGIEYYTAATLALQSTRYNELIQRTIEHLPETDPVRVEALPKLQVQIGRWVQSANEVGTARNTLSIARTARDAAVDDWCTTMERIYGALIVKVGRKRAERYFPRTSRRTSEEGGEGTG
jgi:hypothetical protein